MFMILTHVMLLIMIIIRFNNFRVEKKKCTAKRKYSLLSVLLLMNGVGKQVKKIYFLSALGFLKIPMNLPSAK